MGNALPGLLTPLAVGPVLLAATFLMVGQVLGDGLATVRQANTTSLREALAPSGYLGPVNASMHLLAQGVAPLGALAGGLIGYAQSTVFDLAAGQTKTANLFLSGDYGGADDAFIGVDAVAQ